MRRLTFRKRHHLRKPSEFRRIYATRCVSRQRFLTVFAARNGSGNSRIGLSVSKKHGPAVARNRLKRLLREAFRLQRHDLPSGLDLVLVPEDARDATLRDFQAALGRAAATLAGRLERQSHRS